MADTTTLKRSLAGVDVHPIGLGEMPMSLAGRPDEEQSIRTIHAALDAGVNLIDTADAYARDDRDIGHGERLIAKALKGRRDDVLVATKGGLTRDRDRGWPRDGRPEHLRAACEASLRALETDRIDLYQFHRPDPDVPYAESIGTFKELQDEGKVRWVGISNATVAQLEEALGIVDVVSVQNQLSLAYTSPIAKGELQACTERGIAFLPWSPLGGIGSSESVAGVDPVAARGRGARRVATAGRAGVAALARSDGDPDPGLEPAGDDHRFAARRRAGAHRGRAAGDLRGGGRRLSQSVRLTSRVTTNTNARTPSAAKTRVRSNPPVPGAIGGRLIDSSAVGLRCPCAPAGRLVADLMLGQDGAARAGRAPRRRRAGGDRRRRRGRASAWPGRRPRARGRAAGAARGARA